MAFDFSQLSAVQQYLSSNLWVFADVIFVGYSLYNVIMHFNIGMIGTLFRFVSYVISYFIAKWATSQAFSMLGITAPTSLAIIAVAIFIGAGYILYKNFRYIMPNSMSLIDSILGGAYGIVEVIFFLFLINSICVYINSNGFGIPEWILVANNITQDRPNIEKPDILFNIIRFARSKTEIVIPASKVNEGIEYIKAQFVDQVIVKADPKAVDAKKTAEVIKDAAVEAKKS